MQIATPLLELYSAVTECHLQCHGVRNEPETGIIGRSFYCPFDPARVSLLLVGKNPAISTESEREIYRELDEDRRVHAHMAFLRRLFDGDEHVVRSKFHANLLRWTAIILGVETNHDAVFQQAALTALVKCESVEDKTADLPMPTKHQCVANFLTEEIAIIQPAFLLALGREVFAYLTRKEMQARHGLPVGLLYHPSWTNMKGGIQHYEAEVLPRIRQDYLDALAQQPLPAV